MTAPAKIRNALAEVDTETKRDALDAAFAAASETWEHFSERMGRAIRPRLRLTRLALSALETVTRHEHAEVLRHVGTAVQQARIASRAALEMGGATLLCLRALDRRLRKLEHGDAKPLNAGPLEHALKALGMVEPPDDLPEGSTRVDPIRPGN